MYPPTMTRLRSTLTAILMALCLPAAAEVSLPDIGDPASTLITPAEEGRFGEELLREFRRALPLIDDPLIESYIESLGSRLVATAPDARGRFRFIVVRDPGINAFAAPGGIIGVNTGLIVAARSEAELAAVLAHEIAHVTQRHLARMYAQATQMDFATGLAVLAGIIASTQNPQLGQATVATAMAASQQARLNHSRANEQEADRVGIAVLTAGGYDARAMPDFFERMMELNRHNPDAAPEYLRTHPVTTARIADTRARAEQYGRISPRDERNFALAQARAYALTLSPAEAIGGLREGRVAGGDPVARAYGEAVAKLRGGRGDEATRELVRLARQHPNDPFIAIPHAEALARSGKLQNALDELSLLSDLYPGYPPVALARARVLMQAGRPAEALSVLERALAQDAERPSLHKLKSEAAAADGRTALAHETMADYYHLHGQYSLELEQIELALKTPNLDEVSEFRLRGKRSQVQQRITGK